MTEAEDIAAGVEPEPPVKFAGEYPADLRPLPPSPEDGAEVMPEPEPEEGPAQPAPLQDEEAEVEPAPRRTALDRFRRI